MGVKLFLLLRRGGQSASGTPVTTPKSIDCARFVSPEDYQPVYRLDAGAELFADSDLQGLV
jgi:hypothetical protein